jgi:uncharacterized membrane protein YphA (DoxX/SURF4 family)
MDLIQVKLVAKYHLRRLAAHVDSIFAETKRITMKKYLNHILFGTSAGSSRILNTGLLLFRLHIGLSIAIHAGFPKMSSISAPGWFVDQVASLGFTFPSPGFWAAAASWGEFIGGICIALGLLTRFSALQLAFQFFVISFLWYDNPEPITGMYFQQTLFFGFIFLAFAGGGSYSLDNLIMRKKVNLAIPAKAAVASLVLFFLATTAQAQRKPLTGSGTIINKTFDFKNFDKLELLDLSGKINVEIGKPFSISVAIDDNLEKLLAVSENNRELKIEFKGNEYNSLYIENTNVNINITMPAIQEIKQRANSNLYINNITGPDFKLKNSGNGDVYLKGKTEMLEMICAGNGDVNAEGISAGTIKIKKSGNGDVFLNTDNPFSATGSGNGDISNKGTGKADAYSSLAGNGDFIYPNEVKTVSKAVPINKVHLTVKNKTEARIELIVKLPGNGSYGIDVRPGSSNKESLPVGTKLYKTGQSDKTNTPLYEVTDEKNQVFIYKN